MKIGVMEGQLAEFDLAEVLQVVGIGRQYTGVEVRRGTDVAGTIFVKSGKVVRVVADEAQGREAFLRLFRLADGSFYVYRMETPPELPEPIGAVDRLLMEAVSLLAAAQELPEAEPNRASGGSWEAPTRTGLAPPAQGSAPMAPAGLAALPAHDRGELRRPPVEGLPVRNGTPRADNEEHSAAAELRRPSRHSAPKPRAGVSAAGVRVIAVASPKGGSGKTTVALNLALALARQGRSVILADADINGDVLSAIDARGRATAGLFDVVLGRARLDSALLQTILPEFQIVPATGPELPAPDAFLRDLTDRLRATLHELGQRAEVVIVDTAAGMFGTTHQVLAASTHVLGVLQAESVAQRSFTRFADGLASVPEPARPKVLGVFLNMLQTRHAASLGVLQSASAELPADWLFDTSIPRHPAFLEASALGLPLRQVDEDAPPAVAFLFDNLAAEVAERLALRAPSRRAQRLLI